MKQTLIQRGYPAEQAEKLASQKFIRKTGERPSKLKKAAKAPKPYDPSKKRQKGKKKPINSSVDIVKNILTEIAAITGLIGGPVGPIAPGSAPAGTVAGKTTTTSSPNKEDDPNKPKSVAGATKSNSSQGFSPKGQIKAKTPRAKEGQVAIRPEGVREAILIAKQIEEEFGIY
jgi:hypothetical protein